MHSQKSKKKSIVPEKVEIKKEKSELHPMSHYIDDRVELVKQIFASLKPKTIKNLAPDFLKNASIEDIEELCLNELLGISTKRLTSIICATKCPTDTESSDSDVNNIEEHISLEEISSDSAEENNTKAKKHLQKKNRKKRVATNSEGNQENAKEMSVLELLELQARARAIRSQLALEPIAKIEVDSDDSTDSNTNISNAFSKKTSANFSIAPSKNKRSALKRVENNSGKRSKTIHINGEASSAENTLKRIKLKRNFRKREDDSEQDDSRSGHGGSERQKEDTSTSARGNGSKEEDIKREKSPSPDVITILPSPETLCISDSSEDENDKNKESGSKDQTVEKPIQDLDQQDDSRKESLPESNEIEKIDSEVEDGEILEKEDVEKINESKDDEKEKAACDEAVDDVKEAEKSFKDLATDDIISVEHDGKNATEANNFEKNSNSSEKEDPADFNEDNRNDDVISLEHEELDYEMKENVEEEVKGSQEPKRPLSQNDSSHSLKSITQIAENDSEDKMDEPIDYIELHDDSSENETSQQKDAKSTDEKAIQSLSWNSRWLQSAKVSKILAASRLANRVRDKIKKSKKAENAIVESMPASPPQKEIFSSQFEEGSTNQYKEILEREKVNVQDDK